MVLFHILFVLIEGGGMKFEYSNSKKYTMLLMIDLLQKCICWDKMEKMTT